MNQLFDFYNQYEKPNLTLCNPNKVDLYSLNIARDVNLKMRYNALSELSFTFDEAVDGVANPAYDYIQAKRLVNLEGIGYFIITDYNEDTSTPTPFKTVNASFLEAELINKKISALSGTFKFYGVVSQSQIDVGINSLNLLEYVLALIPNWSIGDVDAELWDIYRTFDVSDTNVYNFLMTDVETAYGCIFTFDSINRTISAVKVENATTNTDIFISKENLLESASFDEISSEIVTALSVYGGNDLNIRSVNPLGSNFIYNFTYYKTTDWMSQGLIDAITAWEDLITLNQPTYATILTDIYNANQDLLTLQSELVDLNTEMKVLVSEQKVLIETGQSGTSAYPVVVANINAKQLEINSKENEITNKETQISDLNADAAGIVSALSFPNNFTNDQWLELQPFIIENTYQNKNIIQTDSMSVPEIQVQAQELYDDAVTVLSKSSIPRYEFKMDVVNFVFLKEFQSFTDQLELGCVVTVNTKGDILVETVLLEIELNFNDPTSFSLTFSNRLRLDNGSFIYSDLFGQQNSAASSVSFNGLQWSNWTSDYKGDVTAFITSSLDASKNEVINSTNQEISIGLNGLRGKRILDGGGYSPNQVWLTSNTLAFTDDNWDSVKLAVGQVTLPAGGTAYGVVGETIVGRLIAGNQLQISNSGGNFLVDASGATLTNANFSVQDSGNKTKIIISPLGSSFSGITIDPGLSILGNAGGGWSKKFWVDSAGNVNFTGNLTGATGTFSGTLSSSVGNIGTLVIDSQGLKTADGTNYLRGNGDLKWGALTISGSNATFNGNIFANNIKDNTNNSVFNSSGVMSGNRLFGGTWSGSSGNSITTEGIGGITAHGNFRVLPVFGGEFSIGTNVVSANAYWINLGYLGSITTGSIDIGGSPAATQSWVSSRGYYSSGSSPSFGIVNASSYYRSQGVNGASTGGLTSFSFKDISNVTRTIGVRGGIITIFG